MRQFIASILMPFFLFCTAVPPENILPDYLIANITITCSQQADPLRITDQQNMGQILQYLRTTPLYEKADHISIRNDPPLYTIHLTHATGRITEYRQLGAEYLSKNNSPWYHIDPEMGSFLIAFFDNSLYNE